MILEALTRYFNILSKDSSIRIPGYGYSVEGISWALNISDEGWLLDILPLYTLLHLKKTTKEVPRRMIVPEYTEPTSDVEASFLCGKSEYVLGISEKTFKDPRRVQVCHAEFRSFNLAVLEKADCPAARAVGAFLNNYDPAKIAEIPVLAPAVVKKVVKGGRLVFLHRNNFAHEVPEIHRAWETYYLSRGGVEGQCLVTGEYDSIAIKHRKIEGRIGKEYFSAPIVSFNKRAFESYNRTEQQGLNAPVGRKAAHAYTAAANYLLSEDNPNRKYELGNATILYWAESESKKFEAAFSTFIDPDYLEEDDGTEDQAARKRAEETLRAVTKDVVRAEPIDLDAVLASLGDENPRFYVLGLSPIGDGRLAVRLFVTNLFRKIAANIMTHYSDSNIVRGSEKLPKYVTPSYILRETVSRKAKDRRPSSQLASEVLRAILTNTPYPSALYHAILNRIHADQDDEDAGFYKINYVRAAAIKAYLLRAYRHKADNPYKEVLTVPLNKQATHPAYLLGCLFAVLEKAQKEAIPGINTSLADRYFASACAAPASVFPTLLRLSRHHIAKLRYGHTYDQWIQEIVDPLDVENKPIPNRLTLEEQGVFVLGYYHQRKELYTGKPKNDLDASATNTSDQSSEETLR